MADRKISELTALSSANLQDVDLLPIVDFDTNNDGDTTDKETKSITIGDLKTSIFSNPALTGYVGIGTSNPQAPLHIDVTNIGSGQPRGIIIQRDANVDGTIMGTISFNNGENMNSPDINNSPRFDETIARIRTTLQSNSDSNSPNPDAGGSMALQTKDEEGSLETRIEIRETGKIGIGTSTPARPVHIKSIDSLSHTSFQKTHPLMIEGITDSIIEIRGGTSTAKVGIDFGDNTNTTESDGEIVTDINNGGSGPGAIIYENALDRMRIKTNNVDAITIDSSQDTTFSGGITASGTIKIAHTDGSPDACDLILSADKSSPSNTARIRFQGDGVDNGQIEIYDDQMFFKVPHGSVALAQVMAVYGAGLRMETGKSIYANTIFASGTINADDISFEGDIINTGTGNMSIGTGNYTTGDGDFIINTSSHNFKRIGDGGASDYDNAVMNDESDTTPIRTIRRMSQSDYNTLVSAGTVDDNTLYIIV